MSTEAMSVRAFALLLGATALTLSSIAVSRPTVAATRAEYRVAVSTGTWEPIQAKDLQKTLEEGTLDVLSSSGVLRLERASAKPVADVDVRVEIRGRLLDEAETFTVYVTLEPELATDVESVAMSKTTQLGGLKRAAMLSNIEKAAKQVAAQLLAKLKPMLASSSRNTGASSTKPLTFSADSVPRLPFAWSDVRIPKVESSVDAGDLYSNKRPTWQAALRVLTSRALVDASPRHVLETCALRHPNADVRLGCLVALRPISRRVEPTQRVVIEVFRKDDVDAIQKEASEQMAYFGGASHLEAVQAWLEATSKGRVFEPMGLLGDVPNLDEAIRGCMVSAGRRPKHQRSHRACIELLPPLGHARRHAILWPMISTTEAESPLYLEGAGDAEGRIGTDWQWAVESWLEGATTWDDALEDALWRRYQRTLSTTAVRILGEYGAPSKRLVTRLEEVVRTAGERYALSGLRRIAKQSTELAPSIHETLLELIHTEAYPKNLRKDELENAAREVARSIESGAKP